MQSHDHEYYIRKTLQLCKKATKTGEVPVGAVSVFEGKIVASDFNRSITNCDPTAHAEILTLKKTAKKLGNYRLNGVVLYVTKEPCAMCAGAMVQARIKELVFGCYDKKSGACGSVFNIANNKKLNHKIKITGGVLENECRLVLQNFFKNRREKRKT